MAPTSAAPAKRQPKVVLRELKDDYCELVLSNTDPSVANVLRRVIISHVPTIAVRAFRCYDKSLLQLAHHARRVQGYGAGTAARGCLDLH